MCVCVVCVCVFVNAAVSLWVSISDYISLIKVAADFSWNAIIGEIAALPHCQRTFPGSLRGRRHGGLSQI